MLRPLPESRSPAARLAAAVLFAASLALAYGGAYAAARAGHLLVRSSPLCDPDRIVPGAGATPAVRVVFAPLIALEETYWLARSG